MLTSVMTIMGNPKSLIIMILDILIMWGIFYYALRIVRNNSRTVQLFKGILLIILADFLAKLLGLTTIEYVADIFVNWGFLAVIIIFQPEIRTILERIGKSSFFSRFSSLSGSEKEELVDQIVTAVMLLSQDETGALICIEQSHSMADYIANGTRINSDVSAELLTSLFVTTTPLHDGAVIIRGNKIACASAYLPPTGMELPSRYGARHRAAIGISEISDAIIIVVSEETGTVSLAENGKLYHVNRKELRDYLLKRICGVDSNTELDDPKNALSEQSDMMGGLIKADEVIPAQDASRNEKHRHHFSLFDQNSVSLTDDEKLKELDEEAGDIKLPHQKDMPAPSYPSRHRDQQEPQELPREGGDDDGE